ncbi:methylated-DNA--[protein]-cysteine S-methyltransferase [Herbidospora mongoliensis]|uniref:methylated-DNA--[protein]-cysteine S-methyltransferase n=1 Tax=Herbidospora mongoliensis TaxID=688067 RepID=UPI0008328692|nr:methylated-DNA--[protein]-cysteine S-methyltransferase [Herbidospora mongoliensis]
MDASAASGDLEALLRVTSPTYVGESAPTIAFGTHDTMAGRLVLAVTSRGVIATTFDDEHEVYARVHREVGSFIGHDSKRLDPLKREIDAYFDGRLRTFTLAFDLRLATAFARSVLQMITSTPYGTTTTYAAVAARIGRPQALRAVANAITENPVCLLVPCHRVVGGSGTPGAYAGGKAAKEMLLNLEMA